MPSLEKMKSLCSSRLVAGKLAFLLKQRMSIDPVAPRYSYRIADGRVMWQQMHFWSPTLQPLQPRHCIPLSFDLLLYLYLAINSIEKIMRSNNIEQQTDSVSRSKQRPGGQT